MFKILGYIIVYLFLFAAGIKLYLWGKKQQAKHSIKWGWRLSVIFFFAPVFIFLIDLCLPIPEQGIKILKAIMGFMSTSISWVEQIIKPIMGSFYIFVKPIVHAFVYAVIGFAIGVGADKMSKDKSRIVK